MSTYTPEKAKLLIKFPDTEEYVEIKTYESDDFVIIPPMKTVPTVPTDSEITDSINSR